MELHYSMLCCQCGAPIEPNPSSMCLQCLKQRVNVAEGVDAEATLLFCRQCERYSLSGDKFVPAELESPQLMGLCLKRIKGLKNCKILDAKFLWTEPHSRRVKVRMLLQKEVLNQTIVEQEHTVTFTIITTMCEECQYTYTDHTWNFMIQVRQKVVHKRTFLYLEQEIMNQRTRFQIFDIETVPDGIDFFFTMKSHCLRFMDFLHSRVPGVHSETVKLVSADVKSNTANKKHSILFEIANLCRDDLIVVPKKMRQLVGNCTRPCIVHKMNQWIHIVDPISGQTSSITAQQYFSCVFGPIRTRISRQRAQVLYCEDGGAYIQTPHDAEAGEQHFCYTHMWQVLKEEQDVWVYETSLIDFEEYQLAKNFVVGQKYYIISRAAKTDEKKVRKIKETKLVENQQDYDEDDIQAVAELYDNDFKGELEAEEVEVDGEGYCPQ
ncbi:Nonsense-mediated_mRNA decay protein 3 [Hexamita inflata]|uniref:60S ribosomal export protein NMD3 n=1 Tax=Hexamita inflata TaxID=28002 RepID=A0AA86P6C8_9EUKA|nr:Nonsense-mediated mRNA decay protein 3 [Hexamita inflata]